MMFIKRAFGEFNKFNIKLSRVQNSVYHDLLNVILLLLNFVCISMKICIDVMDIVMTLLVPPKVLYYVWS